MPIELKILLFVVPVIVVIARCIYLYCMAYKWSRMIMAYLEYKEMYQPKVITMCLSEVCFKIPWKSGIWWNLAFWGDAQDCFESKGNSIVWFEIVDYWYQNRK